MTADVKTFKLKARGDHGSGKTELLVAFAKFVKQFGMHAAFNEHDHHLVVTSTKEQRERLYKSNRGRT
jgi:molybdopterin-guanine dinucleotide biosynthesis protein